MKEKDELRDILSGTEFTEYVRGPAEEGQNLLFLWLERLFGLLERLFPDIELAEGSQDTFSFLLVGAGLAAFVFMSLFLFRLLYRERRAERRQIQAELSELAEAPSGIYARALSEAGKGDYREATRLLFLALLLGFQEQGLLRVAAWKTNWEYAEELDKRGGNWAPLFRESALKFDTVWYGGRGIAPDEFDNWRMQVEQAIRSSGAEVRHE